MSYVIIDIRLFEGKWKRIPEKVRVETAIRRWARGDRDQITFPSPDDPDVFLQVEIVKRAGYPDAEVVRDGIINALLRVFNPEFETMIEAEVLCV